MEIDEARKEIQHLIESRVFENSRTHRRLLEYLATKSLSGETDHLKEYTIGVDIFGKSSSYDPQEDSIVRTQTSRLRLKLLEYYNDEGKNDPVQVEIPKGGFRLEFHRRAEVEPATNGLHSAPQPIAPTVANGRVPAQNKLPWVLCAMLGIACLGLTYSQFFSREQGHASVPWPLSRVVNGREQTTIVLSDAVFAMLRFINKRHTSLEEYLSNDYPNLMMPPDMTPREAKLFTLLTSWPVMTPVDAEDVKTIAILAAPLGSKISIRSSRDLRPRDLVDGNSILLGSPVSNPWISQFYELLNFQEVDDLGEGDGKYLLNRNPLASESERYTGITQTGGNGWAYANVALVPNERWSGSVLILQGLHKEGTAAAGLFLANEQNRAELRRALTQAGANPDTAWFEVLIRAESIAAVPGKIEIVSTRVIHPK